MAEPDPLADIFTLFAAPVAGAIRSVLAPDGLFGCDVAAGETVSACMRLVVAENLSDNAAVARYQEFLGQTAASK